MKLVPEKQFKKRLRKMSDEKLVSKLYTTTVSPNLKNYKLLVEEELMMRGLELG